MRRDMDSIKWSSLKKQIHQRWNKLSDEDLATLDENTEDFIALLRKRYGYGKVQAEIEIDNWLQTLELGSGKYK